MEGVEIPSQMEVAPPEAISGDLYYYISDCTYSKSTAGAVLISLGDNGVPPFLSQNAKCISLTSKMYLSKLKENAGKGAQMEIRFTFTWKIPPGLPKPRKTGLRHSVTLKVFFLGHRYEENFNFLEILQRRGFDILRNECTQMRQRILKNIILKSQTQLMSTPLNIYQHNNWAHLLMFFPLKFSFQMHFSFSYPCGWVSGSVSQWFTVSDFPCNTLLVLLLYLYLKG